MLAKPSEESRTWQDWLGIALGLVILLAPWIVTEHSNRPAVVNAAISGVIVLMLAEFDLVKARGWAEAGLIAAGAWVAASPFIYGYAGSGMLRLWHVIAGLLVIGLGALELWQQRRPNT